MFSFFTFFIYCFTLVFKFILFTHTKYVKFDPYEKVEIKIKTEEQEIKIKIP